MLIIFSSLWKLKSWLEKEYALLRSNGPIILMASSTSELALMILVTEISTMQNMTRLNLQLTKMMYHPWNPMAVAQPSHNKAPLSWHTTHGTAAMELLNSLSNAFDPVVQRAHDADWASHSLTNTQLFTLSQQLHDAQATNDKLHGQLFDLHNYLQESQCTTDHAKLHLEMIQAAPR